jgi:hypothetical protein
MKCTSLGALGVMCGPDVTDATVTAASGKAYRFDFDEMFGPLVVDARSHPLKTQPGERHEFWPAFQAWLDARNGLPPKCERCCGEGSIAGAPLGRRACIAAKCPACDGHGRLAAGATRGEG